MSNFLARCTAIALVGGGFAATGDLGWLAARGIRLINARTVPAESPATTPTDPAAPTVAPGRERAASAPPAADPHRGPVAMPAIELPPPVGGPGKIDLAGLCAGDRVTFWAGPASAGQPSCLAFDVVDPATGEALLLAPGMAARRVTIRPAGGSRAGSVATGESVVVKPAGPTRHTSGSAQAAAFGPIIAIAIGRR